MSNDAMQLHSLKPKHEIKDVKNYTTYKKALDYCFDSKNEINNIGVIGDYGTGKSTIINTYIENDVDKERYDIIKVSLLTLENDKCHSIHILKNIIKQIVQNPKKDLDYNILKFKPSKIKPATIASVLGFIFAFVLIFFVNRNVFSSIPFLRELLNLGIPIEVFRAGKLFLLIIIALFFLRYLYPRILSGIKINKFTVDSTLEAEIKNNIDSITYEELDYLEYLIYLLKREKRDLLLVVEDIDRFENAKIFQQLREVNNLLNDISNSEHYKFIYAVGNSLFSDLPRKSNEIGIRETYQSDFKDKITKFFDFVINITPVMDNQNSYEFIKTNLQGLTKDNEIADEDLFMISQYISSARILADVVNEYQMIKDMRNKNIGLRNVKILYYAILKSRFYNFYLIIHDVFDDLGLITAYYNNKQGYLDFEEKRERDFLALCGLHALVNNHSDRLNKSAIVQLWQTIKNESDIDSIQKQYGENVVYSRSYSGSVTLNQLLAFAKEQKLETVFSADIFMKKVGAEFSFDLQNFSQIVALYYGSQNETIFEIAQHVEILRQNNPNKIKFSIKEFLDIDFVRLGVQENLLDINDYNIYVSQNYLEINDAHFIKQFNLFESNVDLFVLQLFDCSTILSKMKLAKIASTNGLNIHLIAYLQESNIKSEKAKKLYNNAINCPDFLTILLNSLPNEEHQHFDKDQFILENAKFITTDSSAQAIIKWFDGKLTIGKETNLPAFLDALSDAFNFSFIDTDYQISTYSYLVVSPRAKRNEAFLDFILKRILGAVNSILNSEDDITTDTPLYNVCEELFNNAIHTYSQLICADDGFDNAPWLTCFNSNVEKLLPLSNKQSNGTIQNAYLKVASIRVSDIGSINNAEFLSFIYTNHLFDYTANNINLLRFQFAAQNITSYSPFVSYSFENIERLKAFIVKKETPTLEMKNKWDRDLIYSLLIDSDMENMRVSLDFFHCNNPICIISLSELELDPERLLLVTEFAGSFLHSYANLTYLYKNMGTDDKPPVEPMTALLENNEFDFATLYKNIDNIDSSDDLGQLVYNGLFQNESVGIDLFEQYVNNYESIISDISILSSQEKIRALIKQDKIEFSSQNLLACNSDTLKYIFTSKAHMLYQSLSKLQPDEVISIVECLDEKQAQIELLVGLFSNGTLTMSLSQEIAVQYMQNTDAKKSTFITQFIQLLDPLKKFSLDFEKIIFLLSNRKGQRTVSPDIKATIDLLCEKEILSCDIQPDNRFLIKGI